jgi:signal transduction histidine kinase/HD-like signal output (HDOD) protein
LEEIEKLLKQAINIKEIPELPEYAKIVISSTLRGEKSIEQLIRTVRDSPSITLKLLKVANSPLYGRSHPVSNIKDAIVLLGYKTVKSIIISITIKDLFQKKELKWFDYKAFFLHSIAVATLCEEFAHLANLKEEGELYAAGILHDIGKTVFLQSIGDKYEEVVKTIRKTRITFREAERIVFGFDHTDVSRFLLRYWEFPEDLISFACDYHREDLDSKDKDFSRIAVVKIANETAHITGYVTDPAEPPYTGNEEIMKSLGIFIEDLDPILQALKERLSIVSEALNIQKGDIKGYYELISRVNRELGSMYLQNQQLMQEVKKKESLLSGLQSISDAALTEKDIEAVIKVALKSLLQLFPIGTALFEFYINDTQALILSIHRIGNSFSKADDFEYERNTVQREDFAPPKNAMEYPIETEKGQKLGYLFMEVQQPLDKIELGTFIRQLALGLNSTKHAFTNRIRNERLNIVVQKLKEEIDRGNKMAELNRLMLENSPLAILSIRNDGLILQHNIQAKKLFGRDLEKVNLFDSKIPKISARATFSNKSHKEYKSPVEFIKAHLGKKSHTESTIFINSAHHTLSIDTAPIENTQNTLLFIDDITERKENEEFIIQKEKMATLGQLATGIVHNLRSPLTVAKGTPELILSLLKSNKLKIVKIVDGKEVEDTEFQKNIELIEENIVHALDIVDSIVEFAKKDFGSFEQIPLKDAVEDAGALLEHRLSEKNIVFINKTESCTLFGKKTLLTQIFINLLQNSVDAIKEAGTIEVTCHKEKHNWVILFEDNGSGIEEENIEKVFEPFFTTPQKANGTGIGLSITRKLVTIHGGTIKALPRKGGGTVMELRFPVSP